MATKIEWTRGDDGSKGETWNPTTGCTKISPGCFNCYIERSPPMRIAGRKFVNGKIPLVMHDSRLEAPLKWRKPRRIFVNSMSDLFHDDVPNEFILQVLAVTQIAPQHTYQVLTKRPERMRQILGSGSMPGLVRDQAILKFGRPIHTVERIEHSEGEYAKLIGPAYPFPNVHFGVSVENRQHGLPRIDILRTIPAAARFLSVEPLLEDLGKLDLAGIHWVIVGSESGPRMRPMEQWWAENVAYQCREAGVAFFMKQMTIGGKTVHDMERFPESLQIREFP